MRLIDCYLEPLAYVALLVRGDASSTSTATAQADTAAPDHDTVRADLTMLLDDGAHACAGVPERVRLDAEFAVCATIDELILCSSWAGRDAWFAAPLQRTRYGTANAGEEFFTRLSALLKRLEQGGNDTRPAQGDDTYDMTRHVVEVYASCLALGFSGRYFHIADKPRLEAIKKECLDLLEGKGLAPLDASGAAFPRAFSDAPRPEPHTMQTISTPALAAVWGGPVAVLGLLWLVYDRLLDSYAAIWLSGLFGG